MYVRCTFVFDVCLCVRYAELVCSLEEREVSTEASLQSLEKEVTLYQQSGESHRKQCQETCQQVTQLQHLMAEQQRQLDSTHKTLDSRTEEWERESQQHRKWVVGVVSQGRVWSPGVGCSRLGLGVVFLVSWAGLGLQELGVVFLVSWAG